MPELYGPAYDLRTKSTRNGRTERRVSQTPCRGCGRTFDLGKYASGRAVYCSRSCAKDWNRRRMREARHAGKMKGLPTATVGAVSELAVAADLLSNGCEVFRALSASCSCDLAVLTRRGLIRLEVRTGTLNPSGKLAYPFAAKDAGRADVLAVVVYSSEGNAIFYLNATDRAPINDVRAWLNAGV